MMEILRVDGCTADIFEVDGKELRHIDRPTQEKILDKIIKILREKESTEYLINELLSYIEPSEFDMSDRCEQCGDNICTERWRIE